MLLQAWLSGKRGRGAALAAFLRIPSSMVSDMGAGRKQIPLEHCPFIEQFTGGDVTCEELRPDQADYFALIRQQAASRSSAQKNNTAPARLSALVEGNHASSYGPGDL